MPVITDYPPLQVELVRPGRAANPANTQLVESIVTEEDWEFLFPQVQCVYNIYKIYNIYSIYNICIRSDTRPTPTPTSCARSPRSPACVTRTLPPPAAPSSPPCSRTSRR